MEITTIVADPNFEIGLKLLAALFLGMSLGVERAIAGKTAGMRTYGLVTMGSALFVIVGIIASGGYSSPQSLSDSTRFTSQIIAGVGFIGAGLIIFRGSQVSGVTTAAGIWVASGVGVAIGYGLYLLALLATALALFVFTGLWYVENKVKSFSRLDHEE